MGYEEATAVLCDIEQNVDVVRLRHDGLDIWPLVRLMLWQQLAGGAVGAGISPSWTSKLRRKFQQLRLVARAILRVGRNYPKADLVFFISGDERSAVIDGKAISPFADSLRDFAGGIGIRSVTLDSSRVASPYGAPVSVAPEIALAFFRARFSRPRVANAALPELDELERYLRQTHPHLHLNRTQLVEELRLIGALKPVFMRMLKAIAPKAAFFACFYHPVTMGFTLACRALGIRSIDVQHGQQGDYHGMYANWTRTRSGGYDLMPDNFWCWGQQSADRINRWSRSSWPAQQAIVGGNSWMARQIHGAAPSDVQAKLDMLIAPGKIHVLVALQPLEDALPQPLLQAIARSPANIRWLIRLHPKMHGRKSEIRRLLEAAGGDVEMELSSSLPLAELLKRVEFVFTLFSSVAYEALLFGARPVILHESGLKSFKSYIDRDLFGYCGTTEEILALLGRGKPDKAAGEEIPYIETREDVILGTLRWAILKGQPGM